MLLLDVSPNLVVEYDLDAPEMLVEVLHVDVSQHVEDEVEPCPKMTSMKVLLSNFLENDVDVSPLSRCCASARVSCTSATSKG